MSLKRKLIILTLLTFTALAAAFAFLMFRERGGDKKEPETFNLLPVRFEDIVNPPAVYGIWPFGVKGKDRYSHNEGHPGWDFELKRGAKLYAVGRLTIQQIHSADKKEAPEARVIEAAARLGGKDIHLTYHTVVNLPPYVKEGAVIEEGQILGEPGFPLSSDSAMFHFGLFPPNDSIGSCPTPYFSWEAQEELNKIVAISIDQDTQKPYSSACVGKINRTLYEQNYPERIKYLGGAEQFE